MVEGRTGCNDEVESKARKQLEKQNTGTPHSYNSNEKDAVRIAAAYISLKKTTENLTQRSQCTRKCPE